VILQVEDRVRAMPVFRHPLIVEGVERTAGSRSPLQKLLVRATEMFGVSGDRFVSQCD
jgi:hypothetical protein